MKRLVFALAALFLPLAAAAQEATLNGTVTDSTGSVLPGVTVQALHEASGNTFMAVTDGRGAYQLPVRVGIYKITVQLQGFTTVTQNAVEVLVGQTATVNVQMSPSTLAETITVTGESPLVETTSSKVSGNIDPRQITELPSQGRNWMSLALLAPGNRTNAQGATPVQDRGDVREFQLNVDGLQVTSNLGTGNQARYSNDSIAEFEFISNRFDATQGRSSGVQVNAITKSGTNNLSGIAGRQLPRQRLERAGSSAEPRAALLEPADQRHGRRPDHCQQAALLRQLRVRAPAADLDLADAVSRLQRRAGRNEEREAGWRARRLRVVVEHAPDGEGEPHDSARTVRPRKRQPSVRDQHQRRAVDRRHRPVHAGAQQSSR